MQLEDIQLSKNYMTSGGKSALLKPLKKVIISLDDCDSIKR